MRVLHVLDHSAPRRSDYSRRTQELLHGLRAQGVQTVHLTGPRHSTSASGGAGDVPAATGWHFYRTRAPARMERLARIERLGRLGPALGAAARTAALALRLRQVARLTRPDLIHVHLPSWNALAALPVAQLARLPLVVETDRRGSGMSPALHRWLERSVLDGAQALAAGTAQARASLRADGIGGKRISVIPPPPDLQVCRSEFAIRAGLAPPGLEGAPLLAYAGGHAPHDGFELLLSALAVLRRKQPALRLIIAGGGGPDAALAEVAGNRFLRGHVMFAGSLSYRRTADLLPRADIAVFPAMAGAGMLEPSRHLLNAMAQGCAVVASDVACHRELLVHGHSGVLFQAGSCAALVDAIDGLLAQPWRLPALGVAAAAFVQGRRSWELTARRYRRLYETLLAHK
jgi:glycosyltransferase involved in cell wall biosynthesis